MSRLARINKTVMTAVFAAQGLILVGYILQIYFPGATAQTWGGTLQAFFTPILCDLLALSFYGRDKETPLVRYACLASLLLFLGVTLFLRHNPLLYIVGFPILIVFSYYRDYQFTFFSCISLLAINLLAVVYYVIAVPGYLADNTRIMFQIAPHLFLLFTLPHSVRFTNEAHQENLEQERVRAEEISELLHQAERTAETDNQVMLNVNARVQELLEILELFREKALANAKDAEESSQLAERSRQDLTQSSNQMEGAIKAINSIQSISREIKNINNTIDGIAFQTSILALNASVEAARAGDAGRSFAVVAEEVRALSQKSTQAATETEALIQRTLNAINDGDAEIKAAAGTVSTAHTDSATLRQKAESIARSVQEQNSLMERVTSMIKNIEELISSLEHQDGYQNENQLPPPRYPKALPSGRF
ncbi:MAG: methyl-accepting chemotaxis protein [Symbiobacteriaceae bacterium]|nr:methyl-accepting chemotaxis protein [Symbiobacteriaceae bacterium]